MVQSAPDPIPLFRRLKYIVEYALLRLFTLPLALLPRRAALNLGGFIGFLLYKALYSRLKLAADNLRKSFPSMSETQVRLTIRKCWENLGGLAAEFVRLPAMTDHEIETLAEAHGLEQIRKSYAEGKGVIILTGHYGLWELGAKFWPWSGFNIAVVARRIKNPFVNEYINRVRSSHGARVILSRDAVRESIRWLKAGNAVAVLIDHRVAEGSLNVPFLGRPAATTALPALLALKYNVPVHPARCWRENGKVFIRVEPAMDFSDLGKAESDIAEATLRMTRVVETWIRERPEAWMWIHNRWKI